MRSTLVTKYGHPVATLVPYDPPNRAARVWGSMKGTVIRCDAPFDPVPGDWLQDAVRRVRTVDASR